MAIFKGAGVAIVTPMKENEEVNYDKLEELVEWQIEQGTDAIVIVGTTGESSTLTTEEHSDVIRAAVRFAKHRVPVIAGTGSNCTREAIHLSEEAEKAGADGLLAVTPYYNKATQGGLIRYYTEIAEAVKLPIIMYNVPGRTGCNIMPETAATLFKNVENIVGIKEATGSLAQASKLMYLTDGKIDLYSGEDGIVVRGAKMHQTGALNSHQILVMPTQTMREEDRDYAVAFSVPADDPSILYIYGRQASDTRKLEASKVDVGNANYGGQEVIIIFEDTFVPYKNVYMLGEIDFTGMLVERFAGYHRQSYGGCKVGNGDVLIGASQTAAECNGCAKASHIKDKIIEMIHLNETLFSCGIACSCEGSPTRAGNYQIDMLLANVCKQNVTRLPYEIARLAQDIAGGLMVTMPSDADFTSDEVGEWCRKLMVGDARYSVEDRQRILRLIEAMTIGSVAVGYLTESMHGAGSPQAQRIMIGRQANMEAKKALARRLCGIDPDGLF